MHRGFNKFFITGFSGAGKSTLLRELSKKPSFSLWKLIDLDDWIQKENAKEDEALGQYIERVGMQEFRKAESEALRTISNFEGPLILALGAGALQGENSKMLKDFRGLFLDTDFKTCWDRISNDTNRPLVKKGKEEMHELYHERLAEYSKYTRVSGISEVLEIIKSDA